MGKINWYNKPRKSDNFIRWIIFNPKALSILMVMGHLVAVGLFLTLFIFSILLWGWFMKAFSLLLLGLVLNNLYKYYKFQKNTGNIFETSNLNDVVYGGKKQ